MSSVDNRIVRMQFDNAEFERRVSQSLKTLANLKAALTFKDALSNLEAFSNELKNITDTKTFSTMASNIDKVADRFSVLGEIGATVLRRLTNSALDFGKNFYNNTIGQITSGGMQRALNLEQAEFQISGLGKDWKKVYDGYTKSLYDQIDYAVSGTAYGLDAAAKVAGQLLASGLEAGSYEMENALRGISGVAAMTNSTYEDMGQIFTTIASNGKLMTQQLRQFAVRGLNVSAVLAKAFGKTEEEINEMVTRGEVSFHDFAEAMNDAFGKQATKANETYTGSLSNVKAALSRLGAEFKGPYLKNMIKVNNAVRYFVDGVKKIGLSPVYSRASSAMSFLGDKVSAFVQSLSGFNSEGEKLEKSGMIKMGEIVEKLMKKLDQNADKYKEAWDKLENGVRNFGEGISSMLKNFGLPSLNELLYRSGRYAISAAEAFEHFGSWVLKVSEMLDPKNMGNRLYDPVQTAYGTTNIYIRNITTAISHLYHILKTFLTSAKDAFVDVFNLDWILRTFKDVSNYIYKFVGKIRVYFDKVTNQGEKLKNIFLGIFSIFKHEIRVGIRILKIFSTVIFTLLKPIITIIINVASAIGKLIYNIESLLSSEKSLKDFFAPVINAFKVLGKTLKEIGGYIAEPFKVLFEIFKEQASPFLNTLKEVWTTISKFASKTFTNMPATIGNVILKMNTLLQKFAAIMKNFSENIVSRIQNLGKDNRIKNGFELLKGIVSGSIDDLESSNDRLKEIFGNIGGSIVYGLGIAINKIKEFFKSFSGVGKFLVKVFEKIKGAVSYAWPFVKDFFISLGESLQEAKDKIIDFFHSINWDNVLKVLMSFARIFSTGMFGYFFYNLTRSLKEISKSDIVKNVNGVLTALKERLAGISKETNADKIKKIAIAVAILAVSIAVLASLNLVRVVGSFLVVQQLLADLVGIMIALKKGLGDFGNFGYSTAVIGIGISVFLMASTLKRISEIPNYKIDTAVNAIAKMAGIMSLMLILGGRATSSGTSTFAAQLGSAGNSKALALVGQAMGSSSSTQMFKETTIKSSISTFGKACALLGFAFIEMAAALKIISTIPGEKVGIGLAIIAGVGGILASILVASKLTKPTTVMLFAAAINLITLALTNISGLVAILGVIPIKVLTQGIIVMGVISVILSGIAMVSKLTKPTQIMLFAAALNLITMSFWGLSALVVILGKIKVETLAQGLVILTILSAIMAGFALLSKIVNGENFVLMASSLVIIASSLIVLAYAMKMSADVPWEGIGKGLIMLAGALALLLGTSLLISKLHLDRALITLGKAFMYIGIAVGAAGLGLLLAVNALEKLLKLGPSGMALVSTIGSMIIGAIPVVLTKIFNSIVDFLSAAATKITTILIEYILSTIQGLAEAAPAIASALGTIIKQVLNMLIDIGKSVDLKELLPLLGAFAILTAMIAVLIWVSKPKNMKSAGAGLAMMGALVGTLAIIFGVLVNFTNADALLKACAGIAGVVLTVGLITVLLSKFEVNPAAVAKGVLGFGIVVAGILVTMFLIQGVIEAIKGIFGLDSTAVEEMLENTVHIMELIGEAFGSFLGGIGKGVFSVIPDIGTYLSEFMENAKPFFNGLKEFLSDKSVMESVKLLAESILILTAANLLNSINTFLSFGQNPLSSFADQIVDLADPLKEFCDSVKDIDETSIKGAEVAASIITKIAEAASKIPNTGGLLGAIVGNNDLIETDQNGKVIGGFACSMLGAAKAAKAMSNIDGLKDIDTSENGPIQKCADVITIMAEAAKQIPNSGGVLGFWMGENDIDKFANMILTAGRYLGSFANMTGYGALDLEKVQLCADTITILAEAANKIPNTGGAISWIIGNNDIDKFADMILSMGKSLGEFASINGIENINEATVSTAASILQVFSDIAKEIPNTGGIVSWFTGDNRLDEFAKQFPDVGEAIADFADKVKDIPQNINLESITNAIKTLAETAIILSADDYLDALTNFLTWGDSQNDSMDKFETFIEQLSEKAVPAVKTLYDAIASNNINSDIVEKTTPILDFIKKLSETMPTESDFLDFFIGRKDIEGFSNGLKQLPDGINEFVSKTKDITEDDVKGGIAAVVALAGMNDNIEQVGPVIDFFTGRTDWTGFAIGTAAMGWALYTFWNGCDYVDQNGKHIHYNGIRSIDNNAGPKMKEMVDLVVDLSESASKLKDFGNIKDRLTTFGGGLVSLGNDLVTLDSEYLSQITSFMTLDQFALALLNLGEAFEDILTGDLILEDIATFGQALANFGNSFTTFYNSIKDIDSLTISNFVQNMEDTASNVAPDLRLVGNAITASIGEGIGDKQDALLEAMEVVLNAVEKKIEDHSEAFFKAGKYVMYVNTSGKHFYGGLIGSETKEELRSAASLISSTVTGELNLKYNDFYQSGSYLIEGFTSGIEDNHKSAEDVINTFGENVLKIFNQSLYEKSPSKATYQSGIYFVEGYINAIKAMTYSAGEATYDLGEASLASMNKVISEFANSDLTDNVNKFVITPVFDFTELNTGLQELNRIISNGATYSIASNISHRERQKREKETDVKMEVISEDVVKEIGKLREDTIALKEAISHMQIVMDTGVVVGELAPGMDEALGERAELYNRGR